jgi:hypothetical protein
VRNRLLFTPDMQLSPSAEKALEAFEDGSKQCLDCEALLDNTFNIFSLLERWETAESVHRYVLFSSNLRPSVIDPTFLQFSRL